MPTITTPPFVAYALSKPKILAKHWTKARFYYKPFDYLIFIGRFQPVHLGHVFVMQTALTLSKKLLVLIGSQNLPISLKNPFSVKARANMIRQSLVQLGFDKNHVICAGVDDVFCDTKWRRLVKSIIQKHTTFSKNIAIIGHSKDQSSYYLNIFAPIPTVFVPNFQNLSATNIRENFFKNGVIDKDVLPAASIQFLEQFHHSQDYQWLKTNASAP